MQIHNLHALDPQALSRIPPQEFSRLLDRVNAIEGADAADRLMARYSRARKDPAADQPRDAWASNWPTSIPVDEIENMLAELGDDPGPSTVPAETSTSSIEQIRYAPSDQSMLIDATSECSVTPEINSGDFATAINAEHAATTTKASDDTAPLGGVDEDELRPEKHKESAYGTPKEQERKLRRYLKGLGATEDELPKLIADITRHSDDDERGRELGAIKGDLIERKKYAERRQRLIAAGYPPAYIDMPPGPQKDQLAATVRKRRQRAKPHVSPVPSASDDTDPSDLEALEAALRDLQIDDEGHPRHLQVVLPSVRITQEWIKAAHANLAALPSNHPQKKQFAAGDEKHYIKLFNTYQRLRYDLRAKTGRDRAPSYSKIQNAMGYPSLTTARNKLKTLRKFFGPRGPWHDLATGEPEPT